MPALKDKPVTQPKEIQREELRNYVNRLDQAGSAHRDQFVNIWNAIQAQIQQVEPADWALKDDWQSKAIIPLQTKKSETHAAKLDEILFPSRTFFTMEGTDEDDRTRDDLLVTLIRAHLERAKFYLAKEDALQEGGDLGLSFIKFTSNAKGSGLIATWVSPYTCTWDPTVRHDWRRARYWIHHFDKDWADLLAAAREGEYDGQDGNEYVLEQLAELIQEGEQSARQVQNRHGSLSATAGDNDRLLRTIEAINGTSFVEVPAAWATIKMREFWGLVQVPQVDSEGNETGYRWEKMKVVMANDHVLCRVPSAWTHDQDGGIPVFPCRVKPELYQFVGRGYLKPGIKLQDLANSMINLGIDSAKISAMDIIVMDTNKIADPTTIKYKPLQVWKMKDINAVKITRQAVSGLTEILRTISVLDAIDQDASGLTKGTQGTPDLSTQGKDQTLGEFQLKLAGVDRRFLKVCRRIEEEWLIPIVWFVYAYLKNNKVYTAGQRGIDRILGTLKPEEGIGSATSKLALSELPAPAEAEFDFKALGVTSFVTKLQTAAAYEKALARALGNEVVMGMTKIDLLYRALMNAEEIPDAVRFVRTKEEIKEYLDQIQSAQPGAGGGPATAGADTGVPLPNRGPAPRPAIQVAG